MPPRGGKAGEQEPRWRRGRARQGLRNYLLLHGLVYSYTVLLAHLVELIDAHDALVCEHHRPPLEVELPSARVLRDCRGEARSGRALAARVDGNRRRLFDKLEELRLCDRGVA